MISSFQKEGNSHYLLIDGVLGFNQALSHSKDGLVTLEYSDPSKVLCHFQAKVIKKPPQMIWVECPQVFYRVQRRTFYRLKVHGGTEIVFHLSPEREENASVHDYSLGGVVFLSGRPLP